MSLEPTSYSIRSLAHTSIVSEAIALEIESSSGSYLYVIIFTALMYMIAGGFGWLLRAWKIGQLEMLAAQKGTSVAEVSAVQAVTLDRVTSRELKAKRGSLARRLVQLQRV